MIFIISLFIFFGEMNVDYSICVDTTQVKSEMAVNEINACKEWSNE